MECLTRAEGSAIKRVEHPKLSTVIVFTTLWWLFFGTWLAETTDLEVVCFKDRIEGVGKDFGAIAVLAQYNRG